MYIYNNCQVRTGIKDIPLEKAKNNDDGQRCFASRSGLQERTIRQCCQRLSLTSRRMTLTRKVKSVRVQWTRS